MATKSEPNRDPRSKWYLSLEVFNGTFFPTYANGPAYMISGDAVRPLYQWSVKLKPIYLEDVYMTGIVAEKAHIRRLNNPLLTNEHIYTINNCNYFKYMTSHKHNPQEIRWFWWEIYAQPPKPCPRPTVGSKLVVNGFKIVMPPKKAPVNAG